MKNSVAEIIKGYAVINAIAGIIISVVLANGLGGGTVILYIFICIVASFGIFAVGEIIQLLHEIKINTSKTIMEQKDIHSDELPSI